MIPYTKHYLLKLACGHRALTTVLLKQQYPKDEHYIYCPTCRRNKEMFAPSAWQQPTSVTEVVNDEQFMYDVLSRTPLVLPSEILRVQPSKPAHRQRPFPYVNGTGGN